MRVSLANMYLLGCSTRIPLEINLAEVCAVGTDLARSWLPAASKVMKISILSDGL